MPDDQMALLRRRRNFLLIALIFALSISGLVTRRLSIFGQSDLTQLIIGNLVLIVIFAAIVRRVRQILSEAAADAESGRVGSALFGIFVVTSLSLVFFIDVWTAQSIDASLFQSYQDSNVPETAWHAPVFVDRYGANLWEIFVFVIDQSAKALLFDILEVLDITIGPLEQNPENLRFCVSVILYRVVLSATFLTFIVLILRGRRIARSI